MIPKYLYQYTTIDSLEKILATKTLLFNRLDLLNDPYEGIVVLDDNNELEIVRQYIYCSCWTANPVESISMWGIYNDFRGVRIKAKSNLFSLDKKLYITEKESGFIPYCEINAINLEEQTTSSGNPVTLNRVYGPIKIEYVSKVDETYKMAVKDHVSSDMNIPEGHIDIKIHELGNKKVNHWEYENEWRFKVVGGQDLIGAPNRLQFVPEIGITQEKVLVPYRTDFIEIMTGPCVSEGDILEIKKMLEEKKCKTELVKSSIKLQKLQELHIDNK